MFKKLVVGLAAALLTLVVASEIVSASPAGQTAQSLTVERSEDLRSATANWTPNPSAEHQAFFAIPKFPEGEDDTTGYDYSSIYVDFPLDGDLSTLNISGLDPRRDYIYGVASVARDSAGEWVWSQWEIVPDAAVSTPSSVDRDALVAFYHATNGEDWANNANWLSDRPLGEWHGVTASSSGRVAELRLSGNQLSGSIPSELGSLSSLRRLSLAINKLSGSIPPELGNLSNLESLYFHRNQLSGSIPSELGSLSNLRTLGLGDNQLSGSIPSELGSLSNLEELSLYSNQLSGSIPSELGSLPDLEELLLYSNQLSGPIPSELGSLSNLEELDLSDNQLSGAIPSELASLPNLEYLWLNDNQLSGSIPYELDRLSNLEELLLLGNQFSGCVPAILQSVHDNDFTELSIPFCDDRDALVALYHAAGGENWTNNANWLSDRPLGEWHGVTTNSEGRVFVLRLVRNQLSGSIPSELGSLSNLERLRLDRNQLSGPIPPRLGSLSNLQGLHLRGNQLSGPIPPELGRLSNLIDVGLEDNQLSGPIPPELGNLPNLRTLDLGGNQLSGSIPSELGILSSLRTLYLSGNQLSGHIPPELGSLSNLTYADLGDNQLSGLIPFELGSLSNLERLYFDGSQLSGCVPTMLRDVQENDFDLVGLPFCDGAPAATPRHSIETRDMEYGYTIEIPDGWVEEGEGRYYGQESGTLRVLYRSLDNETTLDQYAKSVRDNLRQEWLPSASLFEIRSFEKERTENQAFYSLRYKVRESPMYCIVDVRERIYTADSLPGNPYGFRVSTRFCDWEVAGSRRLTTRLMNSFDIIEKPAGYYTQFIDVEGIAIKAPDEVRSISMHNAADVIETMMTSLREDIGECLIRSGAGIAIAPFGEYITTLPEFRPARGVLDFAGGLGAVKGQPVSGVVESSLLRGASASLSLVTIHEFAHAAQNLCFTEYDHEEWNGFYDRAEQSDLFLGSYGMTNSNEFFAEFSESYFEQPHAIQRRWAGYEESNRQKLSADFPEIFSFLERIYPRF